MGQREVNMVSMTFYKDLSHKGEWRSGDVNPKGQDLRRVRG